MKDELSSRLSNEDIKRFNKAVSKLDSALDRQEEILKKTLDNEVKLADIRLGYLDQYFDTYSKKLDSVARKQSELGDAFLVAERAVVDSYKKSTSSTSKSNNKNRSDDNESEHSNKASSTSTKKSSGRKVSNKVSEGTRSNLKNDQTNVGKKYADELAEFFKQTEEERRNAILDNDGKLAEIRDRKSAQDLELRLKQAARKEELEQDLLDLEIARYERTKDNEIQLTELRLSKASEATKAELRTQEFINNLINELDYSAKHTEEAGETRARKITADADRASAKQIEEARINYVAKKELEARRKNNGILTAEEAAKIQKQAASKFKVDRENLEKLNKRQVELDAAKAAASDRAALRSDLSTIRNAETFEERKQALYDLTHDENGDRNITKALSAALLAISDFAKKLEAQVDEIGSHKGTIDTRLQGSSNITYNGSYWDQIVKDMSSIGAINPFFKQSDFAANIESLVNRGIAFDLEQRAFLMTIQEKIANTFNIADSTLLRLVRIQQEDSTAGRLGMEASLNAFLNNMYETTEYLSDVAASVRGSLEEMESLMSGAAATEVEYQVQKWLGSLYSVGMSQNAVNSISQTLGQIAAGQIEGLTGGGAGNLLIMAANEADLSIADILTNGINASDTNKLMQAVVNYLAEIAESSKDNNVVQQQLASVFGVKASDLRAATNLASRSSVGAVYGSTMSYDNMLNYLTSMASSMGSRTSMTEMITNIWENVQYSLAGSMASNPIVYFLYKMAGALEDTTGGISIPAISIMGNMVDLDTTVADLLRVASISGGIIGSFGDLVSGLSNSFSGQAMLRQLGIGSGTGLTITPRGAGDLAISASGSGTLSTSSSGYVGNTSSSDIKNSTLQEAENTKKQLMVEAKEEEESNQITLLNETAVKIYELLDDVAHGNSSLSVRVEGYGLTKAGSSSAQGGVGVLSNLSSSANSYLSSSGTYSAAGGGGLSGTGVNSGGISGSIDFGGWTTVL